MSASAPITSAGRESKYTVLRPDIVIELEINVIKRPFPLAELPYPKHSFTTIPTIDIEFQFDEDEEEQYEDSGHTTAKTLDEIRTTNDRPPTEISILSD